MLRRIAFVLALAVFAAMAAFTSTASAHTECMNSAVNGGATYRYCMTHSEHYPNYRGWHAYARHHCGFAPFNANTACTADFQFRPIWTREAGAWKRGNLGEGVRLYVYPFTTDWRWGYTSDTGWFAIKASDVTLYWRTAAAPAGGN